MSHSFQQLQSMHGASDCYWRLQKVLKTQHSHPKSNGFLFLSCSSWLPTWMCLFFVRRYLNLSLAFLPSLLYTSLICPGFAQLLLALPVSLFSPPVTLSSVLSFFHLSLFHVKWQAAHSLVSPFCLNFCPLSCALEKVWPVKVKHWQAYLTSHCAWLIQILTSSWWVHTREAGALWNSRGGEKELEKKKLSGG